MKFSLIIGTLNRVEQLKICLKQIDNQVYRDFEVIVVDQSNDNSTYEMIHNIKIDYKIKYIKSEIRGLSRARNIALKKADGEYFCLIDDDGYYFSDYLNIANNILKNSNGRKILSGYIWNTQTQKEFVKYPNKSLNDMSIRQIMRVCPSAALIIPYTAWEEIGGFDENFGIGGKFPAGEETDFLLHATKNNYYICYVPEIRLEHPISLDNNDKIFLLKQDAYKKILYMRGTGALFSKHLFYEKNYILIFILAEMILKLLIKILLNNKQNIYSKKQLSEMIKGFIEYKKERK